MARVDAQHVARRIFGVEADVEVDVSALADLLRDPVTLRGELYTLRGVIAEQPPRRGVTEERVVDLFEREPLAPIFVVALQLARIELTCDPRELFAKVRAIAVQEAELAGQ